jgi:hypothetical protein
MAINKKDIFQRISKCQLRKNLEQFLLIIAQIAAGLEN